MEIISFFSKIKISSFWDNNQKSENSSAVLVFFFLNKISQFIEIFFFDIEVLSEIKITGDLASRLGTRKINVVPEKILIILDTFFEYDFFLN